MRHCRNAVGWLRWAFVDRASRVRDRGPLLRDGLECSSTCLVRAHSPCRPARMERAERRAPVLARAVAAQVRGRMIADAWCRALVTFRARLACDGRECARPRRPDRCIRRRDRRADRQPVAACTAGRAITYACCRPLFARNVARASRRPSTTRPRQEEPQCLAQDLVDRALVGAHHGIDCLPGFASSVAEIDQGASSVGAKALVLELRELRARSGGALLRDVRTHVGTRIAANGLVDLIRSIGQHTGAAG